MDTELIVETAKQASSVAEWLTLAAALIGVIATVGTVIYARSGVIRTISNDRDIAKKATTLEVILKAELTQLHEEAFEILKTYSADKTKAIGTLAVDKAGLNEEERQSADKIYAILNWYEYMAVGIRHDILCEEILRNASYTSVRNIWTGSSPFVNQLRRRVESDTAYETLEELYNRWEKHGYDKPLPPAET